jgi:hypothetical protein
MIRNRRRDPAAWNVLPFRIEYQAMGGEAQQLAPFQLLDQGIDQFLNACGVPAELYKGTLNIQAAPPALRLFENHWRPLVEQLNGFLDGTTAKLCRILSWAPISANLQRTSVADDMNRQMAKLQLMMGRQISQTTGLGSLGMNFEQEQVKMLEENQFVQEKTTEQQQEMQGAQGQQQFVAQLAQQGQGQGQAQGQPAAGAAPQGQQATPGTSSGDMSLDELDSKAQDIATQLQAMPESQRKSQMIQLKKTNPTLYALVKAHYDNQGQKAQTQGKQQVLSQQFGRPG